MAKPTDAAKPKARGNGEGSVYKILKKRKSGEPVVRWVAQVYLEDGRTRRAIADTEPKAKKRLRELLNAAETGTALVDGNATLGTWLTAWQDKALASSDASPRTIDAYNWACSVLRDELGTVRLRQLDEDRIEEALEHRATAGMSRASLVKVRSVLGMVLDFAIRRKKLSRNPARTAELPKDARRPADGRSLTPKQASALLHASTNFIHPTRNHPDSRPHPLHALWVVMLYLGLRPGEATGLLWTDIDLDAGLVHVRRSLKLERGELAVTERLKTDKVGQAPSRAHRTLEALPRVIDALRAHRARQNRARLEAGELWEQPIPDLMFTTQLGGPLHPRNVHRALKAITERAGLGAWHPHELRHSCASLLSAAGVPVERIADQLGHDGTRMGLLVYRHATKPSVDAGLAMDGVLSPTH